MTRAEIERELERMRPRADAERLLSIADPKRKNPWSGAGKQVAALERQIAEADDQEAAAAFLAALNRYESEKAVALTGDINAEMLSIEAQLRTVPADLLYRWDGLKQNFDWNAWARETVQKLMQEPEAEIKVRGDCPLTEAELRTVAMYQRLDARRRQLGAQLNANGGTLQALLRQYPALIDVVPQPSA